MGWPRTKPLPLRCEGPVFVETTVSNGSENALISRGDAAFHLAYRWSRPTVSAAAWFDEPRRPIPFIPPRAERTARIWLPGPPGPGKYRLELTLVQENMAWLADRAVAIDYVFAE